MFRSFFFAGFEGTAARNVHRDWIDQTVATAHDTHADEDYRLLHEQGLFAARETIRWPLVDHQGHYDFSSVLPFLAASRRHGIEIIWDLFHYGYPEDLDPLTDEFVARFAAYCHAAARFVSAYTEGACTFTPVNEPSYLAWAAGAVGRFPPYLHGRAPELKVALARAAIAGIEAIWSAAPTARIVNVDPICHVVSPHDHRGPDPGADHFNHEVVFESLDMISGRLRPELGGSPEHLDIVGLNYYWNNQWEIGREECALPATDPRRVPLSELVRRVWERYGAEMLVTETAHVNDERPEWIRSVADQSQRAWELNLPLRGACLYPVLGMPEWHDPKQWTRMGLWDLVPHGDDLERVPFEPALDALHEAQASMNRFADSNRATALT